MTPYVETRLDGEHAQVGIAAALREEQGSFGGVGELFAGNFALLAEALRRGTGAVPCAAQGGYFLVADVSATGKQLHCLPHTLCMFITAPCVLHPVYVYVCLLLHQGTCAGQTQLDALEPLLDALVLLPLCCSCGWRFCRRPVHPLCSMLPPAPPLPPPPAVLLAYPMTAVHDGRVGAKSDLDFCERLAEEKAVVCTPLSVFYLPSDMGPSKDGEGTPCRQPGDTCMLVRFTICKSRDYILAACRALEHDPGKTN